MAHFEDRSHQHRLSGQEVSVTAGQTRTIFLWVGRIGETRLTVSASPPNALRIEEVREPASSHYRQFALHGMIAGARATVMVSADGATPWDSFSVVVLDRAHRGEYFRSRVVSLALSLEGSHYLHGAAGAAPGMSNGMPGRPASVTMFNRPLESPDDIQHSVATTDIGGRNTCAGRPWLVGHRDIPPYARRAADVDLSLETAQRSFRTVYYALGTPRRRGVILGERCEGKRHFDCVEFINYCLSAVLGTSFQYDICGGKPERYRGYANSFPLVDPQEPVLPADILIFGGSETLYRERPVWQRAPHIGFAIGPGGWMINAMETEFGVARSHGTGYTRRVRIPQLT